MYSSLYNHFCHNVVTNPKQQPLGTWDRLANTNINLNSKPTEDKMCWVSYHKLHKHCISHAAYCRHTRPCLLVRPSSLYLHSLSLSKPWWHHCEIIKTVISPSATEAIYINLFKISICWYWWWCWSGIGATAANPIVLEPTSVGKGTVPFVVWRGFCHQTHNITRCLAAWSQTNLNWPFIQLFPLCIPTRCFPHRQIPEVQRAGF